MKTNQFNNNPSWLRYTSLSMAMVFFYVQVGYGVIEPIAQSQREKKYAKLWEERRAAVGKLRNQHDQEEEMDGDSSPLIMPARVVPPKQEDSFISQLPALNLNILKNSIFRVEPFAPSAIDYFIDSDDKEIKISKLMKSLPTWFQSVPVQFANLEDLYLPPNWKMNDFMVIHIRDAHENYEAQKNTAKLIESLAVTSGNGKTLIGSSEVQASPSLSSDSTTLAKGDSQGMKRVHSSSKSKIVVGLEGAEGSFNFSPYRSFPDKQIVKEVADHLLKESLISGVEFVGMTLNLTDSPQTPRYSSLADNTDAPQSSPSPQTPRYSSLSLEGHPLLFWGIEDRNLYSQHARAFKDSVLMEKQAKQSFLQLKSVMNHLKPNILNPELQKLDSNISQYYQGALSLSKYLKHLTEPGIPSNSPMIRNYMNALALEETLDFDKVETERRLMTTALTEKLSKSELNNLVSASLSYRVGNISYGLFYHYLLELCKVYGVQLNQWPEMDKYVRYVLISDKIKSEDLFREMGELEQKRVKSLISNSNEKTFIDLSQDLGLIEKMVEFKLSPEEWEQYTKKKDEIKKIGVRISELKEIISNKASLPDNDLTFKSEVLESFERFNEAAISRNSALVNNLLKKVYNQSSNSSTRSIRQPSIAVLVAGGFHTTGITDLLKQKKIAYAVFSPKLGEIKGSGADYLNLFRRDKTPLEKLFVGERITLKSPIGTTTEPLGEEVPFILPALEGEFSTLAIARYVLKNLKLHTNLSKELRKEYAKTILNWIQDDFQFHTIHKIQIREIEESRDNNGVIKNLRITLDITGPINGESKTRTLTVSQFSKEEGAGGGAGSVGAGTNAGTGVSGDGEADARTGARVSGGVIVGAGQTLGKSDSAKEVLRFKYGDETIVFIQEPRTLTQKAVETAGAAARSIVPLVLPIWKRIFSQNLLNNRLFVSTVIPILELWGLPGFSLALASLLGIWVSAVPAGILIWISVPVGAFLFAFLHGIPQPQDKDTIPQDTRAPPLNTTQTAPTTGVGLKGWNTPQTDTDKKVSIPLISSQTREQFIVRFVATLVISSIAILLASFLTPYVAPHLLPFIQNMVQPFGLDISSKIMQDMLTYLLAGGLHGVFNWFVPEQYRLSITGTLPPLVTPVTPLTQMTPENKISILPSPSERQIAVVKKTQGSKIVSLQSFRRDKEKRDVPSSSADTPTGKSAIMGASANKTAVTSASKSDANAKIREWIQPVNWIPNIKAILISAVIAVQSLNPALAWERITENIGTWRGLQPLAAWLNQARFREREFNLKIQQQKQEVAENEFNQKIKERELKIANQEMSRIAPSILEDMESLNKTSLNELKDKLIELMTKRMNQSLDKKEYANLKQARTNSMEEARLLLLEDYNHLLSLEQVKSDPAKQKESAVLVMTIFHFLILQDEADLELPFVPHSIKHSLNVRKEVENIISASNTIQANLEDHYGESGVPLSFFSAWLHDIGYGILMKAIEEANLTAKQIENEGDKIAEGYKSEKGYHTVLGVTLAEIPLNGEKGGPTLVNQLNFILGLRDLRGNALGSASAMQDLLLVVKDHGADKEEVTKDGLRGTGKHKLRKASNKQDILNFLVRMADNLDSVAYSRLYKYQTNPFFIEYLRRMEQAYLKDGKKVGEALIQVRAELIQEMEIARKVHAHRLQVVEGLEPEDALTQSNNEFDLMKVYVNEHNGKDYPHFAGMLFSQTVKEKNGKLVVQAVLNDSNRNIPKELHTFQLERMETAYQSLRFNHRKIGIEHVNASEKQAENRVGIDTRANTDLNKRKREQIEGLNQLVNYLSGKKLNIVGHLAQKMLIYLLSILRNVSPQIAKKFEKLFVRFLPDTSGQRSDQIRILEALIHYLKTNPDALFEEVHKSKGEEIISLNDKDEQRHDVYILLDGNVNVFKEGYKTEGQSPTDQETRDRKPSSLTTGSMIRDSAHLNGERTEDVVAGSEGAKLYKISKEQFQNLFSDPQFLVAYAGIIHARAPPKDESLSTTEVAQLPGSKTKPAKIVSIESFKTAKAKRDQRQKLTQTFSESLSELIRNLVYPQTRAVGDPLTSLEQGKKRRLERLGKLKGQKRRESFRFSVVDIDNISKMNDFIGKELIGGLHKSSSDNTVFDNQDETLFMKVRKAMNKAFKNQVHAYVGGDEFIAEWDKEDLNNAVKDFKEELSGRYAVFKIKTGKILSEEEIQALKALPGAQMMIRHGDGYNLLIEREIVWSLTKTGKEKKIQELNTAMTQQIQKIFPELKELEDSVTAHEVEFTISVGAVNAEQVYQYLSKKSRDKYHPKDVWVDSKTMKINEEWVEDFYVWGIRLANDMLKIAKDKGKDQAYTLKTKGKLRDEEDVKKLQEKLIKQGKIEKAKKVKANVTKIVTRAKVWEQRRRLEAERKGTVSLGIDTLTGAYVEEKFRRLAQGSQRPNLYLFKITDYGLNFALDSSRAFHNVNEALDYESSNEVIQILFKELEILLGNHGFTITQDGKIYSIAARAPPDTALVASAANTRFEPGWDMDQMLIKIQEQLNKRFTENLKKYAENAIKQYEEKIQVLEKKLETLEKKQDPTKKDLELITTLQEEVDDLNKKISALKHLSKKHFNPSMTLFHVSNSDITALKKSGVGVSSRFQVLNMMETIDSVYGKLSQEDQAKYNEIFRVTGSSDRMRGVNFKPENWDQFMQLYRKAQVIKSKEAGEVLFAKKTKKKPVVKNKSLIEGVISLVGLSRGKVGKPRSSVRARRDTQSGRVSAHRDREPSLAGKREVRLNAVVPLPIIIPLLLNDPTISPIVPGLLFITFAVVGLLYYKSPQIKDLLTTIGETIKRMSQRKNLITEKISTDQKRGLKEEMKDKLKQSIPQILIPQIKRWSLKEVEELAKIHRVQISDETRKVLHAMTLLQLAEIDEPIEEKGVTPFSGVNLLDLPRVIGYMSLNEVKSIVQGFRELYKEDQKKAEESFGVFGERLFRLGGQFSYANNYSQDKSNEYFEELWNSYLGLRAILAPKEKLSQHHLKIMKQSALGTYNHGARMSGKFKSQPFPENIPNHHTLQFHLSSLDGNGIQSLADQIKKQSFKEERNIIFISTHKNEIKEESLLSALTELGVDQEMLDKLFPMGIGNYLITKGEINKRQMIDPSIEIDPDTLYEIVLERIRSIHGSQVRDVTLDIFTDQMIFKEKWREGLKITLNFLISPTQIVPISSQMGELFKTRELLALQQ